VSQHAFSFIVTADHRGSSTCTCSSNRAPLFSANMSAFPAGATSLWNVTRESDTGPHAFTKALPVLGTSKSSILASASHEAWNSVSQTAWKRAGVECTTHSTQRMLHVTSPCCSVEHGKTSVYIDKYHHHNALTCVQQEPDEWGATTQVLCTLILNKTKTL
jgi:hypothetical protein